MEEMEETHKGCMSWEENIYWTHFKCVHFFQILRGGFEQQLAIPEKFVKNLKSKIPKSVSLKGPSGNTWNVELTTSDATMKFDNGWKEFVKDHALEENELLIFKYNGQSQFDVLMFNETSMCENEISYFVRKCEHVKNASGCLAKKVIGANSVEVIQGSTANGVECASLEKAMDVDDGVTVPSGWFTIDSTPRKRIRKEAKNVPDKNLSNKKAKSAAVKSIGNKQAQSMTVKSVRNKQRARPVDEHTPIDTHGQLYISNRRPITEDEKRKVLQLAKTASTNESLIAVMRGTNVYKKYYLGIAIAWITKHLPLQNHDVILRLNDKTWTAKFNFCKHRRFGGLLAGWKQFALENNLEEFDVCLFEPASKLESSITLDVTIFRVVEEVIPLTRMTPPHKSLTNRKASIKDGTKISAIAFSEV